MKKFAKIVQADLRGQIVIPKEVRTELNIEEGTGFYVYIIENEGILLKLIPLKELGDHTHMVQEIEVNADKIQVKKTNIAKSIQEYKKTGKGNIQNIT
jgi:AbrB family looped-hinge helix DNA binding protein